MRGAWEAKAEHALPSFRSEGDTMPRSNPLGIDKFPLSDRYKESIRVLRNKAALTGRAMGRLKSDANIRTNPSRKKRRITGSPKSSEGTGQFGRTDGTPTDETP